MKQRIPNKHVCGICKLEYYEKDLDISHDIPRYMGGTDRDGRHFLCKRCHLWYEDIIAKRCCEHIGRNYSPGFRFN